MTEHELEVLRREKERSRRLTGDHIGSRAERGDTGIPHRRITQSQQEHRRRARIFARADGR
jgi:hypothetical protein